MLKLLLDKRVRKEEQKKIFIDAGKPDMQRVDVTEEEVETGWRQIIHHDNLPALGIINTLMLQ